jgi:threonylcarbamoyladenosine tRNA methylthiotransferase MtaB
MRRRYDAATYLRRMAKASGFNLTTDVIVGFPTEDEAAFARTLRVVEEAGITKVHVFPYSPRPGTLTADEDRVPASVKKERSARLRSASANACRTWWAGKLGREETVLVDRPGRGYGDDYSPWLLDAPQGEFVRARAEDVTEEGIVGGAA